MVSGVIYADVWLSFYGSGPAMVQQQDPCSLPSIVLSLTQPTLVSPQDPSYVPNPRPMSL